MIAPDDALARLERIDRRKMRIVEMRLFGGLSVGEIAEVLRLSTITIKREWRQAKAWLYRKLAGVTSDGPWAMATHAVHSTSATMR